ncbi:hypothetical protein G6011_06744 [Alternaria panax]|uniref:Uncharacterized protein n=1 Tax=Alternaria panax TaxID=48097 RepID=A0AAD4FHT7_9PLEO|nr:hypothetical protein G6011_06744 [Alternaria panax]
MSTTSDDDSDCGCPLAIANSEEMSTTSDGTFATANEQSSDDYLATGKSGIYTRPSEIHGEVLIYRKEIEPMMEEWISGQSHEDLHSVDMAGKHGIRIPGFLFVPNEIEKRLFILWKQPDEREIVTSLKFEQCNLPSTMMEDQASEAHVPHLSEQSEQVKSEQTGFSLQSGPPAQEARNTGERISFTARQVEILTWNLTIGGDYIVLQRLSSADLRPEAFTRRCLRFTANSVIETKRHQKVLQIRFLRCESVPGTALGSHLPGDAAREYIQDTAYHIARPLLVEREHDNDDTESEHEDENDAEFQEQV